MKIKIETGKLSAKGVVAIPIKVRKLLGVEEGDRLQFEKIGDTVIVRGVKKKSIMDAFGSLNIEFDKPLVDVKDVRDHYRERMIADELRRHDD